MAAIYRIAGNIGGMAVEPKIAIAGILADLNLAVRYGIAICILYASRKFWTVHINFCESYMKKQPILIWRL